MTITIPILNGKRSNNLEIGKFEREAGATSFGVFELCDREAAELAGMSRVEFLMHPGRSNVFPLEAELLDLESDIA